MFSVLPNFLRLLQIIVAILSHGVLPYTGIFSFSARSKTYGCRMRELLSSLGPTFIKFGQSLAARVDIIGEDTARELLLLCDDLPPFPLSEAIAIIEADFHKPKDEIFLEFDELPVASASVAQVYKARTMDKKWKAVKILRPNVEYAFNRDIKLMRLLAHMFGGLSSLQRFELMKLVDTFSNICRLELDLRFEAANAEELRENMMGDRGFCVPKVDWNYTTRRVLTMEWVDATPIYKVDQLEDRETIVRNLILSFCNQVYRDRFFHADMHPGNLMVNANNVIVAVDFGIMGRIDEETAYYISEIFLGFLSRDYRRVAEAHYEAGYVSGDGKCDEFVTACRAIWEPIADSNAQGFSMAELLIQLFKITADFNMKVQPKLLLLQKTMVLVEGICRQLAPEVNLWKVAELWVKERGEHDGYSTKFKRSQAYKSLKRASVLLSKVNRGLDIIIANEAYRQNHKKRKYGAFWIMLILLMMGIVMAKNWPLLPSTPCIEVCEQSAAGNLYFK